MKKLFCFFAVISTCWSTSCSKDEPEPAALSDDFQLETPAEALEFGFGQTRTVALTVTGPGAVDLVLEALPPEGWTSRTLTFVRDAQGGYTGEVSVTAPDRESRGRLKITVVRTDGQSRIVRIDLTATASPTQVELTVSNDRLDMGLGESVTVPFTVTRTNPVVLLAETETTENWSAVVDGFGAEDPDDAAEPYRGTVVITAPETASTGQITVKILNRDKSVLASARIEVSCAKTSSIRIVPEASSLTFGFSEERELEFAVTGSGAVNLTAQVRVAEKWKASLTDFTESESGYAGRIKITSPQEESGGTLTIAVRDAGGEETTADVELRCVSYAVCFNSNSYDFGLLESKALIYTVTGSDTRLESRVIVPDRWRISERTFSADGDGYTGSFLLKSGNLPETNVVWVEITDQEGNVSRTSVQVRCDGGTKLPAPKRGANCIVVSRPGTVAFDAVKGDGTAVSGQSVEWIWADKEGLIDRSSLAYSSGKITFKTAGTFVPGNIVLALTDASGEIVWSWHVWFVTGLNLSAAPGEFMNMNVGATSFDRGSVYEDFGLLYQWGRKDPFPAPADKNGETEDETDAFTGCTQATVLNGGYSWGYADKEMPTHKDAANYPTKMTLVASELPSAVYEAWGPESDPCPKGWRVPTHIELMEHWGIYEGTVANVNSDATHGYGSAPADYPAEWWPAAGCRMTSAGIRNWMGALRLTGGGRYWSSTPCGSRGEYDPEADYQDIGYVSAAQLGWSQHYYIGLSSAWPKNYACSVRCIKE